MNCNSCSAPIQACSGKPVSAADQIQLLPLEEYQRRQRRADSRLERIWALLETVQDPEIPVLNIWEMGILQDIEWQNDTLVVSITPTYSGCPAMDTIATDVQTTLATAGYPHAEVVTRLAPAWSSSWLSATAMEKLRAHGIAPPCSGGEQGMQCPRCGSQDVGLISEFGSTACKALYRCKQCAEPFDHFKTF